MTNTCVLACIPIQRSVSSGCDDGDMIVAPFICNMVLLFSEDVERLPISSSALLHSAGLAVVKNVTGYASDPTDMESQTIRDNFHQ